MKKLLITFIIISCLIMVSFNALADDCNCNDDNIVFTNNNQTIGTLTSEVISDLKQQSEIEGWTFNVGENSVTGESLDRLCGLVEPENWQSEAEFDPCIPIGDLPDRFDWRELGGCTSIKNQASCGSCWAFGTVAPLECNILIHDGIEVDLSEQWLVSCNQDGWSCNGGWWAHKYHMDTPDKFGDAGAVLEEYFPYQASNQPCNGPYPHDYFIDDWNFIGFSGGIPSVDNIKQAIMDYGPVSVAVAVDSAFGAYTEGVFYSDYTGINHAVALVGWDDNYYWEGQYYGVWILRNSWGPGWGQDGYMYIMYNSSKVGYAACYVKYPVSTQIEITGGLGAIVGVRNVGNEDSIDVEWKISANGGLLNQINTTLYREIPVLKPGTTLREAVPMLGFGPVEIKVSAKPKDKADITETYQAFAFFGFSFILN